MSSQPVELPSSPDRSSSPSYIDQFASHNCFTANTTQISFENTGVSLSQIRSPTKRQLTNDDQYSTINDSKRLCNRFVLESSSYL